MCGCLSKPLTNSTLPYSTPNTSALYPHQPHTSALYPHQFHTLHSTGASQEVYKLQRFPETLLGRSVKEATGFIFDSCHAVLLAVERTDGLQRRRMTVGDLHTVRGGRCCCCCCVHTHPSPATVLLREVFCLQLSHSRRQLPADNTVLRVCSCCFCCACTCCCCCCRKNLHIYCRSSLPTWLVTSSQVTSAQCCSSQTRSRETLSCGTSSARSTCWQQRQQDNSHSDSSTAAARTAAAREGRVVARSLGPSLVVVVVVVSRLGRAP